MDVRIFYFSGTGNTLWAVQHLCAYLKDHQIKAIAISLESLDEDRMLDHVRSCDVLGIAWPVYGADMPEIVKDFVRSIPTVKHKPLMTLCTQYAFSGDGAYVMHSQLKKKGFEYRWCFQLNTPSNINLYPIYYKSSDDYGYHESSRLQKARQHLQFLASKITNDQPYVKGATIFHTLAAMLLRPMFRIGHKHFIKKGWLQVAPDACTGCGICATNCPTQNINMLDKRPEFGQNCLFCLRCYDYCPTTAITGRGHAHNFKFGPPFKGPTEEIYKKIIRDHRA